MLICGVRRSINFGHWCGLTSSDRDRALPLSFHLLVVTFWSQSRMISSRDLLPDFPGPVFRCVLMLLYCVYQQCVSFQWTLDNIYTSSFCTTFTTKDHFWKSSGWNRKPEPVLFSPVPILHGIVCHCLCARLPTHPQHVKSLWKHTFPGCSSFDKLSKLYYYFYCYYYYSVFCQYW